MYFDPQHCFHHCLVHHGMNCSYFGHALHNRIFGWLALDRSCSVAEPKLSNFSFGWTFFFLFPVFWICIHFLKIQIQRKDNYIGSYGSGFSHSFSLTDTWINFYIPMKGKQKLRFMYLDSNTGLDPEGPWIRIQYRSGYETQRISFCSIFCLFGKKLGKL